MDRREFLRRTAVVACTAGCAPFVSNGETQSVNLIVDPGDHIASSAPVRWATGKLEEALTSAGLVVERRDKPVPNGFSIIVSGASSPFAADALERAPIAVPETPGSLALLGGVRNGQESVIACGFDARGLSYAVSEITDRVRHGVPLQIRQPIVESPANPVRSVMRQFTSELLDKPWFYDRDQWAHYLDQLAMHRWNRLDLAFGLGYDALNRVDDSYFLFLYPFVVSIPEYKVRATNVPDSERERNLKMLQFISEQTVARGIDFQLGIWMHGYHWPRGRARNIIEGLTPETHAPYCRDALTAILKACPSVSSVGLRIHGESGVAEGSYDFWATVFDGVKRCGRTVEIDLHAKGVDERMIEIALATGMPTNLSPKYSAEHFGMPYHQAAIREIEMPVAGHEGKGLMTLSEGSRIFTRYGYADLLREDRSYSVRSRIFSGTQRILLSADPVFCAAYARSFAFCGSRGADLMEPLTCRGRRGSAVPGRRSGYAEVSLEPRWDWQKYASWYRVWGRLMYNPETSVEVCRRGFENDAHADELQSALSYASRILPIVTTAYLPSAACDAYWPEIYWNQSVAGEPAENPYSDTFAPKVFQNASPLDPQLFSSMKDAAHELLNGQSSGKYSPIDVAGWLDGLAATAMENLKKARNPSSPDAKRVAIDVRIQAGLGGFFAAKFRAGVLYAIYEQTADRRALEEALHQYRAARSQWADIMDASQGVYAADLSVSDRFDERGQWVNRLPGIDSDIAELEQRLAAGDHSATPRSEEAIAKVLRPRKRNLAAGHHTPPQGFVPNASIPIDISFDSDSSVLSARLFYRHVNQAERFQKVEMEAHGQRFSAQIPGAYAGSQYPLQYYFELRASGQAWLYPGFGAELTNQPYFVLRQNQYSKKP